MEYESNAKQDAGAMAEGRLIYTVSAIMRKASDRALAPMGLSVAQAPVLVVLRESRRPMMITEIARSLHLETPSVTTMVDRLSERGLVERVKDSKDRRKALVSLTRKGKNLVESTREPGHRLEEEMFGALNSAERKTLRTLLQKFRDANLYRLD
jgi:DNA-binding MarR family transcriptional regulator